MGFETIKDLGISIVETQQLSNTKTKLAKVQLCPQSLYFYFLSDVKCLRAQFTEPLDTDVHFIEEFMQEAKTIQEIKSVKLTHT